MTSELVSLLYSLNPISLFLSLSHFCNICSDPMEIIIIKEREREREREEKQIDDEAEEKAINASQKKEEVLRRSWDEREERAF